GLRQNETGTFVVEQVYQLTNRPGPIVVGTLKAPELRIGDRLYLRDRDPARAFTIAAIDYSPASGRFGLLLAATESTAGFGAEAVASTMAEAGAEVESTAEATGAAESTDVGDVLRPGIVLHTAARYRTVRPGRGCPDNA